MGPGFTDARLKEILLQPAYSSTSCRRYSAAARAAEKETLLKSGGPSSVCRRYSQEILLQMPLWGIEPCIPGSSRYSCSYYYCGSNCRKYLCSSILQEILLQ